MFLGWPISRILSGGARPLPEGGPPGSSCPPPGRSSIWDVRLHTPHAAYPGLRTPRYPGREPLPGWITSLVPAWPCSGRGLPGHRHCCPCRWSLTPPFHPCLGCLQPFGGLSLWPFRQISPPRELPGAPLFGVRTFLASADALTRPPGQPVGWIQKWIDPMPMILLLMAPVNSGRMKFTLYLYEIYIFP